MNRAGVLAVSDSATRSLPNYAAHSHAATAVGDVDSAGVAAIFDGASAIGTPHDAANCTFGVAGCILDIHVADAVADCAVVFSHNAAKRAVAILRVDFTVHSQVRYRAA